MKSLFGLVIAGFLLTSASAQTYNVAVIPKGTSHEFWKSIHAGANKAAQELAAQGVKVNVNWKGPLREDDRDQQIGVVENFTIRRAHGIVLAPLDSKALVAPVEKALASKIPVVIIDSGLQSEKTTSYVATDNFKGGQLAGEKKQKVAQNNTTWKIILLLLLWLLHHNMGDFYRQQLLYELVNLQFFD